MAKLIGDSINASDISQYCESESDFAFELQTLALLNELGASCEHGGMYEDPVTQKARQFDIRGLFEISPTRRVRLAVECKNVRPNYPLVVLTVPRRDEESYHEFIHTWAPRDTLSIPGLPERNGETIRLNGPGSAYPCSEPVGKSCCQVGRDTTGAFRQSDSEAYDKWSQAIQSAHELVDIAQEDWKLSHEKDAGTLVLAVLVVPDQRLWTVHYDNDGATIGEPSLEERASLYVNKFVPSSNRHPFIGLWLSHIEVVTHIGLRELVDNLKSGHPASWFGLYE
ncbi:hypothetical protein [Synechococcus sp. CBW1107]|uniref:hypothetical protein n=1 Tax=Synechococcus sp. CBW1107 TaxID=2789857 RepID=UPI002AD4B1D2|nr:hypothetical protein [Synechococcus sp. CBW1107]CAK6687184.1 hypothetical protein ICNINCKA_00153 [Synechococcus sp. CBW1107]